MKSYLVIIVRNFHVFATESQRSTKKQTAINMNVTTDEWSSKRDLLLTKCMAKKNTILQG